jgi:TetR/AcrR family transcriptional repressor of nem operon
MKVSAEKKAQNRKAILTTAGRLLRAKGPDGIGVAEVMDGAGLTHGAFYGYFPSREALTAEAVSEAMEQTVKYAESAIAMGGFDSFVRAYLSPEHLAEVEDGCPIAATVSEMARQPQVVRAAFASGMKAYLDGASAGQDRNAAISRLAGMIGALAVARAVAAEDRGLAEEILSAVCLNQTGMQAQVAGIGEHSPTV